MEEVLITHLLGFAAENAKMNPRDCQFLMGRGNLIYGMETSPGRPLFKVLSP
jgi:hypothetical protein